MSISVYCAAQPDDRFVLIADGGRLDTPQETTSAQRLKQVFGIDIETCPAGSGAMRSIACIEAPEVIK